jgi:2',3'-cyclic-nucleotide 2'-phosphodiesterase (5'-nucleotidase family)
MKSKKWVQSFLTAVLAVSLAVLVCSVAEANPAQVSNETTVAIMTTADLQSSIAPYTIDHDGKQLSVGGLERISSAARKVRGQVDGALLLSSGDDLIPPLFSMFHGIPEMRGMSLAGYDIVTPGNHEFDIGAEAYKEALSFVTFPVVSANLIVDDQELRVTCPH